MAWLAWHTDAVNRVSILRVQIMPKRFIFSIIKNIHCALCTLELMNFTKWKKGWATTKKKKMRKIISRNIVIRWYPQHPRIYIIILIHNKIILALIWSAEHNQSSFYTIFVFEINGEFHFIVVKGPCISLIALTLTWIGNENVKRKRMKENSLAILRRRIKVTSQRNSWSTRL